MPVTGKGRRKVLVVAEAPGEQEDEQGIQLIGKSGQYLRDTLSDIDVDLDRDCWKTNAVICRPPKNEVNDIHIESCRPNLNKTIKELNPTAIILLGGSPVKSLIGQLWKAGESPGGIGRWAGWQIPSQKLNAWVCPTFHPAYLLRKHDVSLELWFKRHLQEALALSGRPWEEGVPDFASQVEIIYESDKAARIVRRMTERGGTVAFDYETNMLKPDHKDSRIVCCSVCWEGMKTIAFPWHGEVVTAMGELLRSNVAKVGANNKFEQRWTRKEFGHGVRNWVWDCMTVAHILDYRPLITSVKFQAFVQLGQTCWDGVVGPYLRADSGYEKNRIKEVDLGTLLMYCGMDSLCEWMIAEKQKTTMARAASNTSFG
jgi:uracil-DNA glycosylase family 4